MPPRNLLSTAGTICQLAFIGWTAWAFNDLKKKIPHNHSSDDEWAGRVPLDRMPEHRRLDIQRSNRIGELIEQWIHDDKQVPWHVRLTRGGVPKPKELEELMAEEEASLKAYFGKRSNEDDRAADSIRSKDR